MNRSTARHRLTGFTMIELMITVAIIGIVGSVAIAYSFSNWRDSQLTNVLNQFAGWLEEVRGNVEELEVTNPSTGLPERTACTVSFATTNGTINAGGQLASVSPTGCAAEPIFRVTSQFGTPSFAVGASAGSVVFTPRTAVTATSDIQLRMAIANQNPVRCVRISAGLGLIRLGRNNNSSDATADCPASSFNTF